MTDDILGACRRVRTPTMISNQKIPSENNLCLNAVFIELSLCWIATWIL